MKIKDYLKERCKNQKELTGTLKWEVSSISKDQCLYSKI